MLRWTALGAIFFAIGTSAAPALAAPAATEQQASEPILRLTLTAPDSCPTERELVNAVLGLVGHAERTLAATIVITEWEGRFYAELALLGGERQVDGATCRALSEALVVILALTIDPKAATNVAAFDPKPTAETRSSKAAFPALQSSAAPATAAADAGTRAVAPQAAAARSAEQPHGLELGASALLLVETGILPKFAFGASGLFRVRRGPWSAELGAGALLPRSEALPSAENTGGTLAWASALSNGCFAASPMLAFCLGLEVGRVFGKGFGVDREYPAGATWLAGAASGVLRIELSRDSGFETRVSLAVPSSQPTFGIAGEELYATAPVSARFLAGIAFQ
jgi:hypothetical protein